MKLRFKVQSYQAKAVDDVMKCFEGQPTASSRTYRIDPGRAIQSDAREAAFKNADLTLSNAQILDNIQKVQRMQNLPVSKSLVDFTTLDARGKHIPATTAYKRDALAATDYHLDIEMETGTGKTYCYIRTIFEMNKCYGWSKFIIMVPSIAIREGVYRSLQITAEHFTESYGKKVRFFIYSSKRLHDLESFSSDAGINVMVINIQAFNARGIDSRRINEKLDEFQSRKPIEVIASNHPILILDEPQKMEGAATMKALPKFNPLFILRYSATHRTTHNRIHRLDALDAYNQKLVKKISVRGINARGLTGTNAYLYLEGIDTSKGSPTARVEMEIKQKSGEVKRRLRRLEFRDNLFATSGELDQYRNGFTISQIDAVNDRVEFTNGVVLKAGDANGNVSEFDIRRIQIRETIRAHLDKEKQLYAQGIKVLSLFFIDEVVKYRDYDRADQNGEYARIFIEEYELQKNEYLSEIPIDNEAYRRYLEGTDSNRVHNGYFAIDKKNRLKDPDVGARSIDSDDVNAYDLILKDKERLLSFSNPTRFIFSHSALREGWDNPNVFVICMLKHSNSAISRRQEVGRGLRLSVNQNGDRMDNPSLVHDINVLTVVASESYKNFVGALQKEISETLSSRPLQATKEYFIGKILATENGPLAVTAVMAKQIYRYLVKNDYTDDVDQITSTYREARGSGTLASLPDGLKPYEEQVFQLIDSVFSDTQLPKIGDGRKPKINPLNENFDKKEFQEFWARINRKVVYRVEFDSAELIRNCIGALSKKMNVTDLQYTIQVGVQHDELTDSQLRSGDGFSITEKSTERGDPIHSLVKYDLVGKVAENVSLTRNSVAHILSKIEPKAFEEFRKNPEHFISEASRIIYEQKAAMVIERLAYDEVDEQYNVDIFTASQAGHDFSRATAKLKNHVFDYAITDSEVERNFVTDLDTSSEVVVYAKLPRGFLIPTPVGDYNPDWAISFRAGSVRHIYFVAETKGTMSTMKLREEEKAKIECARRFFDKIGEHITSDRVKYDVVTDYNKLMDLVARTAQ